MANNELQFIDEVRRLVRYNLDGADPLDYEDAYGILQHLFNHQRLQFDARQADMLERYAVILSQVVPGEDARINGINRFVPRMINRLIYDQVIGEERDRGQKRPREPEREIPMKAPRRF